MNFEKTQKTIEKILAPYKARDFGKQAKNRMKTSDAIFCAEDKARNRKFRQAIEKAINKHKKDEPTVVDAGAGTGILGLFALIHGAKHSIFIEENEQTLQIAKALVKEFGYTNTSFIHGDARATELEKNYDILISETISSDFQTEDFVSIVQNLKIHANKGALLIPSSCNLEISEKDQDENLIKKHCLELDLTKKIKKPKWDKKTTIVSYSGKITLFDNISIKSGETMSFFNIRKIKI